jgi:hypothetical protein
VRTSIGQACAVALAAWLRQSLTPDVEVTARWPNPDKRLAKRALSVVPVGRRTRNDAMTVWLTGERTNISPTQATVQYQLGGIMQPLQMDIWASSEDERDDVIAQLDDVMNAGLAATLNVKNSTQTVYSDPVRDGILLPLAAPFAGLCGDFWFDDVAIDDTPDAIQRAEYRATYLGEARAPYTVTRTVPRLLEGTIEIQTTLSPPATVPTTEIPYRTVTLSPDDSTTPPSVTVTYGTSTTPSLPLPPQD